MTEAMYLWAKSSGASFPISWVTLRRVTAGIVRFREGADHYLVFDASEYWSEGKIRW